MLENTSLAVAAAWDAFSLPSSRLLGQAITTCKSGHSRGMVICLLLPAEWLSPIEGRRLSRFVGVEKHRFDSTPNEDRMGFRVPSQPMASQSKPY